MEDNRIPHILQAVLFVCAGAVITMVAAVGWLFWETLQWLR